MDLSQIKDLSTQLKAIAKDLSFLGHPRYPLKALLQLFPQHKVFIDVLEDVSVPYQVDVGAKRLAMEKFLTQLEHADIAPEMKKVFSKRIEDYQSLLIMMEHFGSPIFYDHCLKLYGSSAKSMGSNSFFYFLEQMPDFCVTDISEKKLMGEPAMDYLRGKLKETFEGADIEVRPSSSLLSDASAGRKTFKLNPYKAYTTQMLDIFLVHEGWAHLGTSLNGAAQEHLPWLSSWAPRTTYMQEGLAILTELMTGHMTKERWNKVVMRHLACSMAERGSPITDVYAYLRHHQMGDLDALKLALRVFRGVPLEGGMAFTKELLYLHGLLELLYHLHIHQADIESLWIGKISFEEHSMLLKNWQTYRPQIKYFPKELKSPEAQERLKKLKELSFSLFNHGFL